MAHPNIDQPVALRDKAQLDIKKLTNFLKTNMNGIAEPLEILQFPGGFSNLTYAIQSGNQSYVLRRPPLGANIRSAHDMHREFRVLSLLAPVYSKIPQPVLYCDDETVIGAPFYIMSRVKGLILRNQPPKGIQLTPAIMEGLSKAAINNLVNLHKIDLEKSGLSDFGKPEGYISRQVEGWIGRYKKAQTDEIADMDQVGEWLIKNQPQANKIAFIHNDYKYDNLVLNPEQPTEILAVLDWEMATVGHPFMDLGTTLSYWCEASDSDMLKFFSLTWLPGNLDRQQVVQYYEEAMQEKLDHPLFYFAFGLYKLAVIAQQIYARYKKGLSKDERFGMLIFAVQACAETAIKAIEKNRISKL